jgi:hypothetical protein
MNTTAFLRLRRYAGRKQGTLLVSSVEEAATNISLMRPYKGVDGVTERVMSALSIHPSDAHFVREIAVSLKKRGFDKYRSLNHGTIYDSEVRDYLKQTLEDFDQTSREDLITLAVKHLNLIPNDKWEVFYVASILNTVT